MTDKELLEFAAKTAGYDFITVEEHDTGDWIAAWKGRESIDWNPLTDDGDAFRLMVQLGMYLNIYTHSMHHTFAAAGGVSAEEPHGDDPEAATRRAIVRAAAEIGKGMGMKND